VEGPRDRDLLRIWAQRRAIRPAAAVRSAVILGGRQPLRAIEHFRRVRATAPAARGLCVLDRDHEGRPGVAPDEPGLEFFTWSRRHIESYLLVPDALRRSVRSQQERFRLDRALRDHLPREGDEGAWRAMDAKRLLGREGALARALGRPIPVGRIARTLRWDELHDDVVVLLERIRRCVEGEPA